MYSEFYINRLKVGSPFPGCIARLSRTETRFPAFTPQDKVPSGYLECLLGVDSLVETGLSNTGMSILL